MPQIWPMNWILLMVFFVFVFVLFISLIYFNSLSLSPSSTEDNKTHISSTLNWKW